MPFQIEPGQKVLFIGDSITDCSRRDASFPLGNGYVRMIVDLIRASAPDDDRTYINRGVSGNTVRNLLDRWTDDCIVHRADWVSIMIGINDNHSWLSNGQYNVGPAEYEKIYDSILLRLKNEAPAKLVLMTPFYMSLAEPAPEKGWRCRVMEGLPPYIQAVERLAAKYNARLINTHEMFHQHMLHRDAIDIADEPVHPKSTGHLMLAHQWLKAMGW